ncbi:hypothetical protein WD019_03010 [Fictibacillus sp. Mic-4]|uniref:hypothetical protein n=1 Tax=Fictibacillus sp. Mic-4 TaxID=3132826 RepID=UPI003CE97BF0
MKAGKELDALIAEKVMGWHRKGFPGGGGGFIAWVDKKGNIQRYIQDCTFHACRCEYSVIIQLSFPKTTNLVSLVIYI